VREVYLPTTVPDDREDIGAAAESCIRIDAKQETDRLFETDEAPSWAAAVTEIEVKSFTATEAGAAAVMKEWEAMTSSAFGSERPRLIRMTANEARKYEDPKGQAFKRLLKLRFACSQKRATPEQLNKDPNAGGKMKARLVAQDLKVNNPADPKEVYAPVPEACVFRLLVASHHIREYDVSATDVTTAYLQGDSFPYDPSKPKLSQWIPCKVFHPLLEEWVFVWMTGEIYGRQPAGCNWHKTLTRKHAKIGMQEGLNAKSVYFSKDRQIKTAVHVDDPITLAKRSSAQPYPADSPLKAKYYSELAGELDLNEVETLSTEGDLDYLSLRMSVSDDHEVNISNADFVYKFVEKKGMAGCNPAIIPISKDLLKIVAEEAAQGLLLDDAGKTEFQSDVGAVMWIATTYCPKLATAVSLISKWCANPTISCPRLIKHLARWLAGNVNMCLKTVFGNRSGLRVFCDSDHAGMIAIIQDPRSRLGIVAMYNGMPILWMSAWIKAICLSSGEAEVYALAEAAKVAQHLKFICQELMIGVPDRVPIYCDASAAIGFADNLGGTSQSRLKHIDLRRAFVAQLRDQDSIEILKIDGKANPANFFTKILSGSEFQKEGEPLMSTIELPKAMADKCRIRGHGKEHSSDPSLVR
jgi:hypothetical protein